MAFQIDDRVVLPGYGIGRVQALVPMPFAGAEARLCYEVAIERSTVWVPVDGDPASGLRPLASRAELDHCRSVLRRCPLPMLGDPQLRRQDVLRRLKVATLCDLCEVVRDLSARSWGKSLNEADAAALRRARESLCGEWSAVCEVPVPQAMAEINTLLQESRVAGEASA